MSILMTVAFLALVGFIVLRSVRRTRKTNAGRRFEWSPSNVLALVGLVLMLPGLWILRVDGWTETWSTDLATGETTTTSTFGSQLAKAVLFFVAGGALIFAAKVMARKRTDWPPSLRTELQRLGISPHDAGGPRSMPSGPTPNGHGTSARFNAPPGWPVPPVGWTPPSGWNPDPSWPAAPPGWQFWTVAAQPAD